MQRDRFHQLEPRARLLVATVTLAGGGAACGAMFAYPPQLDARSALLILLAVAAGLLKVPLPAVGTFSLAYAFILATLMTLGLGGSAAAAVLSALASSLLNRIRGSRAPAHRVGFNAALMGLTSVVAGAAYLSVGGTVGTLNLWQALFPLGVYAAVFVVLNLGIISLVVQMTGAERVATSLSANLRWTAAGYTAGTSLAVLLNLLLIRSDPVFLLLASPFVYLLHRSYTVRTEKALEEKRHTEQTARLYTAITEALALAIEAKDENTEEHLRRVREYSLGVGEALDLPQPEMEALRAAALLHDVGKIAVPEYILTKPGRLTEEEFEKIKIHPTVGADILETVPFPYPLAPIVRHHHERWDGTGYPEGIAGEQIPLGARILSVVDCYDALTTDRPYRKALSREEALSYLRRESGRMFDPRVVDGMILRAERIGEMLGERPGDTAVAHEPRPAAEEPTDALVEQVRGELLALADRAARVSDPDERLRVLADGIRESIPHRTLVIYRFDASREHLVGSFATGHAAEHMLGLRIAVGERLSGWAAQHQRPYRGRAHVNPLERDGSRSDLEDLAHVPEVAELGAFLVTPLSTDRERLGVVALYNDPTFEYVEDHARRLRLFAEHVSRAIRPPVVPSRQTTADPLTLSSNG